MRTGSNFYAMEAPPVAPEQPPVAPKKPRGPRDREAIARKKEMCPDVVHLTPLCMDLNGAVICHGYSDVVDSSGSVVLGGRTTRTEYKNRFTLEPAWAHLFKDFVYTDVLFAKVRLHSSPAGYATSLSAVYELVLEEKESATVLTRFTNKAVYPPLLHERLPSIIIGPGKCIVAYAAAGRLSVGSQETLGIPELELVSLRGDYKGLVADLSFADTFCDTLDKVLFVGNRSWSDFDLLKACALTKNVSFVFRNPASQVARTLYRRMYELIGRPVPEEYLEPAVDIAAPAELPPLIEAPDTALVKAEAESEHSPQQPPIPNVEDASPPPPPPNTTPESPTAVAPEPAIRPQPSRSEAQAAAAKAALARFEQPALQKPPTAPKLPAVEPTCLKHDYPLKGNDLECVLCLGERGSRREHEAKRLASLAIDQLAIEEREARIQAAELDDFFEMNGKFAHQDAREQASIREAIASKKYRRF